MSVRLVAAESTDLFVGPEETPLQIVRITVAGAPDHATVTVTGPGLDTPAPVPVPPADRTDDRTDDTTDPAAEQVTVEVPVAVADAAPGAVVPARAVVRAGDDEQSDATEFDFVVAEPGWTMHMVSHFHYDPVWWNTQAAYTNQWDALDFPDSPRSARQLAGFDLVRAHLELALRDPDYRFVLAEVDYLKPYWDTYPADRALLRRLVAEGRVEIMGGTYNEPNTNLTHPETTIRNLVHGAGFQRNVLGADPRTAWQLDAFGHDPAFPGLAAAAGLSSSSWARGPFHQWGPAEVRDGVRGDVTRMQFPSEFEWLAPSGHGLLTSYMADHYSAGWWMDSAPSLAEAEQAAHALFRELARVATTRNVLLPVGTDYTPPNRWVTAIHHDWNSRYTWPRFVCSLPRDFFAAVRAELAERGEQPSPQTRDMNPVYTGKDVSYIDTKQAQRAAEQALLDAERFAVFACLLTGACYPDGAFAKAWAQLVYGAHHDAITGSEGDQVYLDLLTSWRQAHDLAATARNNALSALTGGVDISGPGAPVVVWNPLAADRSDLVTVHRQDPWPHGVRIVDDTGADVPAVAGHGGTALTFRADDVPSLGWRTFWLVEPPSLPVDDSQEQRWTDVTGTTIANEHYRLTVDPGRGGGVSSLVELPAEGEAIAERELIADGRIGNELAVYEEYAQHPRFGEGPWHLLPRGPVATSGATAADSVHRQRCRAGERLVVSGRIGELRFTQVITLWRGIRRVDCVTTVDEFTGADQLLRVRWPCPVPGALPVSEVGNAVVGRGFGLIDVDAARHPWTLDNPAHTWFGLSAAAAVRVGGHLRPLGVAEVVVPEPADAGTLARDLVVALARSGVTATCGTARGSRYGDLDVDSNLPDFRVALGGPDDNPFTAEVLRRTDPDLPGQVRRSLAERGRVVLWVPATRPLTDVWVPGADLRDAQALPVLVVAGATRDDLVAAVRSVVADLDDHVIDAEGTTTGDPGYAGRTVALVNRGMPGFAADTEGTLHLSLLRSCTGWPSGVWIDPPRRTVPDGSNFQLQHWTHEFRYALVTGDGDWRQAGLPGAAANYSAPLLVTVPAAGQRPGSLSSSGSLLRVEPANSVALGALKAAGNPLTRGYADPANPAAAITLRLVAVTGEPVTARVSSPVLRFTDPAMADLLEQRGDALPGGTELAVDLTGFDAVTVVARPKLTVAPPTDTRAGTGPTAADRRLAPDAEPARPLYARYWLHNRGPAPLGGLPASVHLFGSATANATLPDVRLRLTVVSDRTDGDLHGRVRIVLPGGWRGEPANLPFGLPPGGYTGTDVVLTVPPGTAPGCYPVRAQLELLGSGLPPSWGQVVEDVTLVTVPGSGTDAEVAVWNAPLPADLLYFVREPRPVRVAAGERTRLTAVVGTAARAPLAVEAQLVSPWGTWTYTRPAAIGTEVPPRGALELSFSVAPPPWTPPGTWWGLVKVAGAGKLLYSAAVPIEVTR